MTATAVAITISSRMWTEGLIGACRHSGCLLKDGDLNGGTDDRLLFARGDGQR